MDAINVMEKKEKVDLHKDGIPQSLSNGWTLVSKSKKRLPKGVLECKAMKEKLMKKTFTLSLSISGVSGRRIKR
jgi:hypothetical protein